MRFFGKHSVNDPELNLNGLDESAKQNPFTTPDGYFDKLSSDILSKVNSIPVNTASSISTTTIAAIIISAVVVGTVLFFTLRQPSGSSESNSAVEQKKTDKATSYPKVILTNEAEVPVVVIRDVQSNPVIIIDADENAETVHNAIAQLPFDNSVIDFVHDEYSRQSTNQSTVSLLDEKSDESVITKSASENDHNSNVFEIDEISRCPFALLPKDTCSESAFTLSAYYPGAESYVWSTGENSSEISIKSTGNYKVTVTLADGSLKQKSINVRVVPKPDLSSNYLITACSGSSHRLSVEQKDKGYKYLWPQYQLKAPFMTVSRPGLYYANITGCKLYTDSFFVVFSHCELGIPNIVSPDGDNHNETFMISNLEFYPNTELYIYDKSNKLIFKSTNYQNNWDATSTPDGTYYYLLRFTDGTTEEGLLTVNRK